MKKPFLIILSSALATGAVIKAAPALAEPVKRLASSRLPTWICPTDSEQKTIDHRLVIAVQEVCGTASDVDLAGKNAVRQCRTDALGKARALASGSPAAAKASSSRAVKVEPELKAAWLPRAAFFSCGSAALTQQS